MQQFFFGKLTSKEADNPELDKESCYRHNDNYYLYRMDITDEGITFYDTCNRSMPFDNDSLYELQMAAYIAREHDLAHKAAEKMKKDRINRLAQAIGVYYT